MPFAYPPYLISKITVDDRALNAGVLRTLRRELTAAAPRVLELGAGIGTMAARLSDWKILQRAHYTLLDTDAELLNQARNWLGEWASARGYVAEPNGDTLRVTHASGIDLELRFLQHDAGDPALLSGEQHSFDLLVANAVLDLVHLPVALPTLLALLNPDGLYWFSINFDGDTIFIPEHRDDAHFMRVYHASMDRRTRDGVPAGDSKTGRNLFTHLRAANATILDAGSSDWVVYAREGQYPAREAEFLRCIIQTIHDELGKHADVAAASLDAWTKHRLEQIDRGDLVYIAHQLDFVGRPGR